MDPHNRARSKAHTPTDFFRHEPPPLPLRSFQHVANAYKRSSNESYMPPGPAGAAGGGSPPPLVSQTQLSDDSGGMLTSDAFVGSTAEGGAAGPVSGWTWDSIKVTENDDMDPDIRRRIAATKRHNRTQSLKQASHKQASQSNGDDTAQDDGGSLLSPVRRRWGVGTDGRINADAWGRVVKRIFGIGRKDNLTPDSRLIYPMSPFSLIWLGLTCTFLAYTAIVVPAVISFHWLDEPCVFPPTLIFDCLLDSFFLLDIVYNFGLGVVYQGKYHDDWRWVAKFYLQGSFLFDFCTSIPVSFVELAFEAQCAAAANDAAVGIDDVIDPSQLRFIRAAKPLRYLKV